MKAELTATYVFLLIGWPHRKENVGSRS